MQVQMMEEERLGQHNIINNLQPKEQYCLRDCFCAFVFLVNIFWMVIAMAIAFKDGNPDKLNRVFTGYCRGNYECGHYYLYSNHSCGMPGSEAQAFPYAFYSIINPPIAYCVSECPTSSTPGSTLQTSLGTLTYDTQIYPNGSAINNFAEFRKYSYDSYPAFGRICIPSWPVIEGFLSRQNIKNLFTSYQINSLGSFVLDLINNWPWISLAFLISILLSIALYLFGLRCFPKQTIWLSIIGNLILLVANGLFFLYSAGEIYIGQTYGGYLIIPGPKAGLRESYKIFTYLGFVFFVTFLLLALRYRIKINQTIETCQKIMMKVRKSLLCISVIHCFVILAIWGGFLVVFVYLASNVSQNINPLRYNLYATQANYSDENMFALFMFLFSTLWLNSLIHAFSKCIIISYCCDWYHSIEEDIDLLKAFKKGYQLTFQCFGSIAEGSFFLMFLQAFEFIAFILKRIGQAEADENKCLRYIVNAANFLYEYADEATKYINESSYIQIILKRKCFFEASKLGHDLKIRSPRFQEVRGYGFLLQSIVCFFIALLTATIFYTIILFDPTIRINVMQPVFLLLVVFLVAHSIASTALSIYGASWESLITCYVADQRNDLDKNRHILEQLQSIIQVSVQAVQEEAPSQEEMNFNQA